VLCNEAQRVQAYFDGELDAGASAVIEQHLAHCSGCAALIRDLQSTHDALREEVSYHRASGDLRSRLNAVLHRETTIREPVRKWAAPGKSFWLGAASGFMPAAFAAALAVYLYAAPASDPLSDDLLGAHLRSLVGTHLIDVASTDQHTVKPWFAGHADVSPPAIDFPQQDYRLIGGRADYVDGHRAAVVVYRHGAHLINVFAWAQNAGASHETTTRNGYHIVCWRSGDLAFCAVSDTAMDELLTLTQLLKNAKS
jgi:anti-sigma factor RsiW